MNSLLIDNSEKLNNRKSELDLLKLLALTFVCISHVIQRTIPNVINTKLFEFFYSLHMGLFFFVSGVLVKKVETFKVLCTTTIKRFFRYVYPAILFTVLTVLIVPRYSSNSILYWLDEFVERTDTFYWFLIDLFIIIVISYVSSFISNKINSKPFSIIVYYLLSIVFVVPFIILFKIKGPDFLSLDLLLYYYPFYILGTIFSRINIKSKSLLFVLSTIFLVIYILTFINLDEWVTNSNFSLDQFDFVKYTLSSLFGVMGLYFLFKLLSDINIFKRVSKYGKYSLEFYLIHVLILRIVTPYVSKIEEINFYSILFVVIYTLIIYFSSLAVCIFMTKSKIISLVFFGNKEGVTFKNKKV